MKNTSLWRGVELRKGLANEDSRSSGLGSWLNVSERLEATSGKRN